MLPRCLSRFDVTPRINSPYIGSSIYLHQKKHQSNQKVVRPEFFCSRLNANDFSFYCGVPDSLLKDFCGYVTDNVPADNHIIVPNEGSAIGVASGYYLNTGKIPIVYFQNSGLGNAVNPLLSLTHQNVYSIPMLLLIGWRGEPGKKDEPQHLVTGNIMCDMLKLMKIPYETVPDNEESIEQSITNAKDYVRNKSAPFALLVKKETFETYNFTSNENEYDKNMLTRKQALGLIVDNMNKDAAFVSTTGFTSRELYEIRKDYQSKNGCNEIKEFLIVGSMGHATSIAYGIALTAKRDIVCIDGDGASFMHMGNMSLVGNSNLNNLKHILINNGVHDSVGAQPTNGFKTDFVQMAKANGYKKCESVSTKNEIISAVQKLNKEQGPYFLEIKTIPGASKDLSRPSATPEQNKIDFMSFLSK